MQGRNSAYAVPISAYQCRCSDGTKRRIGTVKTRIFLGFHALFAKTVTVGSIRCNLSCTTQNLHQEGLLTEGEQERAIEKSLWQRIDPTVTCDPVLVLPP